MLGLGPGVPRINGLRHTNLCVVPRPTQAKTVPRLGQCPGQAQWPFPTFSDFNSRYHVSASDKREEFQCRGDGLQFVQVMKTMRKLVLDAVAIERLVLGVATTRELAFCAMNILESDLVMKTMSK